MVQFCKLYCAKNIWALRCGLSVRLASYNKTNQIH